MEGKKIISNETAHIQCQLGNKEDVFYEYFMCSDVTSGEHLNIEISDFRC